MYFVANFLILSKPLPGFVSYLAVISIALAFVASCIGKKGEELVGTIFQMPFTVINSFGDIASYIRLFAVGYAAGLKPPETVVAFYPPVRRCDVYRSCGRAENLSTR
jgi:V/A-type H+-transporting ATPase subunit I